jgi:hypothetical protein
MKAKKLKIIHYLILSMVIICLIAFSCQKYENASSIPQVTFKSFTLNDKKDTLGNIFRQGELIFDFVDGNSDFGINTQEPGTDTSSNLILIPYQKVAGEYLPVTGEPGIDTLQYSIYENAYFDPQGKVRTIRGEVTLLIDYFLTPYDTIRYNFFIIDRAGNRSNIATTTDIGFR